NPKVEIRISATPKTQDYQEIVNISRQKVIAAQMIKDGITINPSVADNDEGMTENEYLLEQAIRKREEIKSAYEKLGVRINPLLLIQMPNDNKETLDDNERSLIEMIKTRLDAHYGINTNNGKLAIWLSNEKQNLDGISESYNVTEALLFKQAIALGWDCPRAAVLLIFRDIKSEAFGIQTVGRIMRMPEQKYYPNQILNHGWVYTNLQSNQVKIEAEDFGYITKSLIAYRREELQNVSLPSVYSERLSAERNRLGAGFKKVLYETFNNNWLHAPYQPSLFDFIFEKEEDVSQNEDNSENLFGDIAHNRKQTERIAHIDFSNHGIVVQLISDVEVTGEAGTTDIEETQRKTFARNSDELAAAMTKWCAKMLPGFESQSALSLRGYLYEMMEELLGVFETEAPRIMLYYANRPKFEEVILKAIAKYKEEIEANRQAAKKRAFKEYQWEVPQSREYNEKANHVVPEVKDHALMPFVKLNNASNAETNFEAFLEQWADCIDWWYKNGDEGKQHYSIAYIQTDASQGLFYVDYIIRMKNGQIFLFDTKTQGSDIEAPQKHNALLEYMNSEKNASLNLKGGVIIEQGSNWMYSESAIDNTNDLSGWTA
ncbi:MAG: restriction endonuclease subunit R, partial [Prevotella sp.]|nr:restriction endonuclease subunit R [Prevotella sp.]